jgi:hypothetical protein
MYALYRGTLPLCGRCDLRACLANKEPDPIKGYKHE